jgi:hypothetical protein
MILSWPQREPTKPGESFRHQQAMWRRAYTEAYLVRDRFPHLEQLVLDVAFTDRTRIGTYSAQMHSFCAGAKAFFAVACPRTLCLDGGFDLDSVVATMLEAGATSSIGLLECAGWVKPVGSEAACCALLIHYRLQARYSTPLASSRSVGGRG